MDVSVLIPTHARTDKLGRCLAALADQSLQGNRFEVIVGFDGSDMVGERSARHVWERSGARAALRVRSCPREGYTLVRNRLVAEARGRVLVSLNDDVRPAPDFLAIHLGEHDRRARDGLGPAIVVGHSPYTRREHETLLDRLVRCTSMVFFYDVMNAQAHDAAKDWGFRHCFGLNFSAPTACMREVGGFFARPHLYGYDDIELGFRLCERFNTPVLYRPAALAEHEHFYTPRDLIDRERSLGRTAWHFAEANPAFGLACFGRDIRADAELEYCRAFVENERAAADRMRSSFVKLGDLPGACLDPSHEQTFLNLISQQFTLLKRWEWRSGLLEAAATAHAMA